MVKCVCINDKDRPKEIPAEKWVKKDEAYHVTFVAWCLPQRVLAFSLYEKPLDESCHPYEYFVAERFGFHQEDLEAIKQLCRDCNDLDDLQVEEIVKENVELVDA